MADQPRRPRRNRRIRRPPSPFTATRYHSLVVDNMPDSLLVNATSETSGLDGTSVMERRPPHPWRAIPPGKHRDRTRSALLANFLTLCGMEQLRHDDPARPIRHLAEDEGKRFSATSSTAMSATMRSKPTGMTERSETSDEIAGRACLARALIPTVAPDNVVDCCGTVAMAITRSTYRPRSPAVAAAGVPVAKHGNRAASSKSGAADTLEALGLDMEAAGRTAERTLAELGICFLFAKTTIPRWVSSPSA